MPTSRSLPSPLALEWGDRASRNSLAVLLQGAAQRIPVLPSTDRMTWSHVDAPTRHAIERRANAEFGTPWPQPLVSQYARYFRDGNRTDYEGTVAERQHRLSRAVLMAAFTDSEEWIDEAADGIALLCEQSSWSWAAHDDTHALHGYVVPTQTAPYLDLGAGEVVGQLAWADHVIGDALDGRVPGIRARIRHESELRVIGPFLTRQDWPWLGLDGQVNNWNPWIYNNVTVAAIFLVDDTDRRAEIVARAIEGLDRYLASLPLDGAIDEGFSYWWQGAARALEMLDLLRYATAGALDAAAIPVVQETLRFPHRMHFDGYWYLNLADGRARSDGTEPWQVPYSWGKRIGDAKVMAHAAAQRRPDDAAADSTAGLGRILRTMTDSDWIAVQTVEPPLVRDTWLGSIQVLLTREHPGTSKGPALAIKGGHNGESHNHKDIGSFVVALDGRPLMVDAGQPTYTAQTFGPDRYLGRPMQSGWHSVPAPWGLEQGAGSTFHANEVERIRDGERDGVALQLESAYPLPATSRLRREAMLHRIAGSVIVTDSWHLPRVLEPAYEGVQLNYLLAGNTQLIAPNAARVINPDGGHDLELRWSGDRAEPVIETWHLEDPLLSDVWGPCLTRLTLNIPESTSIVDLLDGSLELTIRPVPALYTPHAHTAP